MVGDRAYGFLDMETGKVVSAKRPKRYGALLECRARFLSPPQADAPTPPLEVTFPNGTVVRDDPAEVTRRVTALLGRDVRLVTSPPEGAAAEAEWPDIEGLVPDAAVDAMTTQPSDDQGDRVMGLPRRDGSARDTAGRGRAARSGGEHAAQAGGRTPRR